MLLYPYAWTYAIAKHEPKKTFSSKFYKRMAADRCEYDDAHLMSQSKIYKELNNI